MAPHPRILHRPRTFASNSAAALGEGFLPLQTRN